MYKRPHAYASSVELPVTRSRSAKQNADTKPASLPFESMEHFWCETSQFTLQTNTNTYVGTITEDGGTIKIPSMQCLTAQGASRNKNGCHTYATTKASYIGMTNLQINMDTSRYNYGRWWHHWNTVDAMPNSLRSKPQQKWMLYLCNDRSVVHRDDKPTNKYRY